MREEGLVSIDFFPETRSVVLVYEPDAPYSISEIMAYCHDMTEGRMTNIQVYEDERLTYNMQQMGPAGWVNTADNIANKLVNGV